MNISTRLALPHGARRHARGLALATMLAGTLACMPVGAAGQDMAALLCIALAGLGTAVLWLLREPAAPAVAQPESIDERWHRATAVLNDVALQINRLALLSLTELESSKTSTPAFVALTEQMRVLARHSADSARLARQVDPHHLPRGRGGPTC